MPHDHALVVAVEAPACRTGGMSGRAAELEDRPRRLTPGDRDGIRLQHETRSLRKLAADFEVSHETIRSVLGR